MPVTTLEITRGSNRIRVQGKRSRKGWNIFESHGASQTRLGFCERKEKAIKFARDCLEPDTINTTILVIPAS